MKIIGFMMLLITVSASVCLAGSPGGQAGNGSGKRTESMGNSGAAGN